MQPNSDMSSSSMNDNTTTTTTGNGQAVLRIPINMSGLQQTTTRADDMNAQGRPKRKQVKNACGKFKGKRKKKTCIKRWKYSQLPKSM